MSLDRLLEPLLTTADNALRSVLAEHRAARPTPGPSPGSAPGPGAGSVEPAHLSDRERRHVAGLMRVNHSGEVAAQALYQGQAAFARNPQTRELLLHAGREETDHLAWCEQRLKELDSRPSLLTPLWYAGSFALGAAAAALGDRVSLGIVAETERQVEGHLESHLDRLPPEDARSRAILEQMKQDEIEHGQAAIAAGGTELPTPIKEVMRATARVMTFTSYWV